MTFSIPSFNEIGSKFIKTFKRFPLGSSTAILMMFLFLYLIETDNKDFQSLSTKLLLIGSLGIFLFPAIRFFGNRLLCLAGVLLMVVYYFTLPDFTANEPDFLIIQRHSFLVLTAFITLLWSGYAVHNPSNRDYWEWVQQVLFALFTSALFSLILFGGMAIALLAIDKLFPIHISGKLYAELYIVIYGLFSINYFLSQIPENHQALVAKPYSKVETIFAKYILTPITVAYFFILFAYTAKILITLEWPKGMLTWIIFAFSVVAIITYLFRTPFSKPSHRFLFIAILLQSIVLGLAIYMRINEYGWTENRYLIVLFGLWLFVLSLYFILNRDARYKWIFVSLSAILLVSQIGPISAYEVGKISQQKRLVQLLNSNQPLSEKSDIEKRYQISDKIQYLYKRHRIESLEKVIPKIVSKYREQKEKEESIFQINKNIPMVVEQMNNYYGYFPEFATNELGFQFVSQWDMKRSKEEYNPTDRPYPIYSNRKTQPLSVKKYDWVVGVHYNKHLISYMPKRPQALRRIEQGRESYLSENNTSFYLSSSALIVKESQKVIADINLSTYLTNIFKDKDLQRLQHGQVSLDSDLKRRVQEKLSFDYKNENVVLQIRFDNIFPDINSSVVSIDARVLYKRVK